MEKIVLTEKKGHERRKKKAGENKKKKESVKKWKGNIRDRT